MTNRSAQQRRNRNAARKQRVYRRQNSEPQCVWPYCEGGQFWHLPICSDHLEQINQFIIDMKLNETREEALTRGRRQMAADRRASISWGREKRLLDTRGNQPGWIYYLHINDMVKIGYTTDIVRRIRDYPPNSPLLGVHPGTPELEKQFHEIFKGSLAQGREWFRLDPDVLAHCEKVRAEYGDPAQFEYRTLAGHETRQVVGTRNRR